MEAYERIIAALTRKRDVEHKGKTVTVRLWWVVVAVVFFVSVAATDYLTEGFTTVGPFLD